MNERVAKNSLEFLKRITLKGEEVPQYVEVVAALAKIVNSKVDGLPNAVLPPSAGIRPQDLSPDGADLADDLRKDRNAQL